MRMRKEAQDRGGAFFYPAGTESREGPVRCEKKIRKNVTCCCSQCGVCVSIGKVGGTYLEHRVRRSHGAKSAWLLLLLVTSHSI